MSIPIRRLLGFAAVPAVAAFTPLISIAVIQRSLGESLWNVAALGMAVGMFGSGMLDFGYGVLGPSRIAKTEDPELRRAVYQSSLRIRAVVAAVILPVLFVLSELLAPPPGITGAGMVAVATAIVGFAPNWYYIGSGRPGAMVLSDTIPRLLVTAIAAAVLVLHPSLNVYGSVMTVGLGLSYGVASARILRRGERQSWRLTVDDRADVRAHMALVSSGLLSAAYTTWTIPLVRIVNPLALGGFSAAERLRGMIKQVEMAVGNGLQHWVSERFDDRVATSRRMRASVLLLTGVGAVAAIGTATLLPWVQELISGGQVAIDSPTAMFSGISLLFIATGIALNFHVLAPLQQAKTMAIVSATVACVGLPTVLVLGRSHGAAGAMAGVAIAEGLSCLLLGTAAHRVVRRWVRAGQ